MLSQAIHKAHLVVAAGLAVTTGGKYVGGCVVTLTGGWVGLVALVDGGGGFVAGGGGLVAGGGALVGVVKGTTGLG